MIPAKYVTIRSLMQLHTLLSRDATVNPRPWQPARARPPAECLWLLLQIVLKNVVEPLPVQRKPEIFSVADDLVLYNRLIRLLERFF